MPGINAYSISLMLHCTHCFLLQNSRLISLLLFFLLLLSSLLLTNYSPYEITYKLLALISVVLSVWQFSSGVSVAFPVVFLPSIVDSSAGKEWCVLQRETSPLPLHFSCVKFFTQLKRASKCCFFLKYLEENVGTKRCSSQEQNYLIISSLGREEQVKIFCVYLGFGCMLEFLEGTVK